MQGLSVFVAIYCMCWIPDEYATFEAAEPKHPFAVAREAIRSLDKAPSYLHLVDFGPPTGKGIVAGKDFSPGDFITYYHGIHSAQQPELNEPDYDFLFKLNHYHNTFWIDASEEDGSYGRILNDDWKTPNARTRVFFVDGQAHLAFLARRFIKAGEEIRYNYKHGATTFPWRQPKKHPFAEAREAIRNSDMSPSYLRVVDFGPHKGRGIVAGKEFSPGDFITYYHGIHSSEKPYLNDNDHDYLFKLNHYRKSFWIDASEEDGSYGRLLNDECITPNARPRVFFVDGEAHIAFLARRFIRAGEEIRFSYKHGATTFPWRQKKKQLKIEDREANRSSDIPPSYLHEKLIAMLYISVTENMDASSVKEKNVVRSSEDSIHADMPIGKLGQPVTLGVSPNLILPEICSKSRSDVPSFSKMYERQLQLLNFFKTENMETE